jgi:hypothetical protein
MHDVYVVYVWVYQSCMTCMLCISHVPIGCMCEYLVLLGAFLMTLGSVLRHRNLKTQLHFDSLSSKAYRGGSLLQ